MVRAILVAAVLLLAWAPSASAHAVLEGTEPQRGAQLDAAPDRVTFSFSEPVEASFGAVRVYDRDGERVDDGRLTRPGGGQTVAVGLPPDLEDGGYTATYRVISADSHPVSGGFVFSVGDAAAAPAASVSELMSESDAGPVTSIAFGAVRALAYAAVALALGALGWLMLVWARALPAVAGSEAAWLAADRALLRRLRLLLSVAVVAGVASAALALVFQGAVAGGTSVWEALAPSVIGEVLETRYGELSALRLVLWLLAGAMLAVLRGERAAAVRPAMGAAGVVPARPLKPLAAAAVGALIVGAALTFGLSGHAGSIEPTWLLVPSNALHVLAMGLWVGGLVVLVAAMPAATRELDPPDRTRLLAAVIGRFSPLAVGCVALLVAMGIVQSIVHLGAISNLVETAFGRAILIKAVLLLALVGLGAYNQRRLAPRLRRLAEGGEPPGAAGRSLRSAVRAEVAFAAAAIVVTAALVSYNPASAQDDVLAESVALGPARMEITVEPLQAGPQEVHVYLFDAETGEPFRAIDEFGATASLADKDIGPLDVGLRKAGPGHYTTSQAPFSPGGEWELDVKLRTGRFDIHSAEVEVPIR